jgi:anti-sigma factor RsiW
MEKYSSQDHIAEDLLDAYAIGGRLDDKEIETLEEHLLVCAVCQERLECIDSLRQALRHLHDDPKQSHS